LWGDEVEGQGPRELFADYSALMTGVRHVLAPVAGGATRVVVVVNLHSITIVDVTAEMTGVLHCTITETPRDAAIIVR
jgi:hypothetical protein